MKRISWLIICLFLVSSCTKSVEVGQDEIGLVFSYWDGEIHETLYEPGIYKISYISGFTAAKIITLSRASAVPGKAVEALFLSRAPPAKAK